MSHGFHHAGTGALALARRDFRKRRGAGRAMPAGCARRGFFDVLIWLYNVTIVNVEKHVAYWIESAREDRDVANHLLRDGKIRHGLFFLHLTIEKVLKAIYCKRTSRVPPKIHNLLRLAELVSLNITEEQRDTLSIINKFNNLGRYPESSFVELDGSRALGYLKDTEEIFQWLIKQL